MPPIYLGETPITKIYKGEAQMQTVAIGETIVSVYTTTTSAP